MEVILTSNIRKVGKIGDIVNVKDGFARNYLFPQKKAIRKNKENLEYLEKQKTDLQAKELIIKEEANKLIEKISNIEIFFEKEADEKDQLYGSVSKREIMLFFSEKDIKFDIDLIEIPQQIKSLGDHKVLINPYEGITKEIKIKVSRKK